MDVTKFSVALDSLSLEHIKKICWTLVCTYVSEPVPGVEGISITCALYDS